MLVISSDDDDDKKREVKIFVSKKRDIFFSRRRKLGAPSRTPPCIVSVSYIYNYSTTAAATFFFFFLSFCFYTKRKTKDAFYSPNFSTMIWWDEMMFFLRRFLCIFSILCGKCFHTFSIEALSSLFSLLFSLLLL